MRVKDETFITITGINHYYGIQPFSIGNIIRCVKEPDNIYDAEAISCAMPIIGKVGYVANSSYTVAAGTFSSGRVYDKVDKEFLCQVHFRMDKTVICKVLNNTDRNVFEAYNEQGKFIDISNYK